eukprot:scaffold15672_cov109-Isochrysis_galbana.AAC.3
MVCSYYCAAPLRLYGVYSGARSSSRHPETKLPLTICNVLYTYYARPRVLCMLDSVATRPALSAALRTASAPAP